MENSTELFEKASKHIPGGVNSPVRAFKSVGGSPPFITSGSGCRIQDVDGKEYIDYIGSWGPMILGHRHPAVVRALEEALARGTSFGTPSPPEVELASEVVARVPGMEMVRFVNSGTEATLSAVRLARAATGRNIIVKFAGGYHGHADSFLIQAGSGAVTFGLPDSPGVTPGAAQDTCIARFNDLDSVAALMREHQNEVAAVIIEPVPGNMGVIPPGSGFLQGLRELCSENGTLLIFDEVMSGFRVARGGAQELYGVTADLITLGKVIGGGLPVGAYGGKRELMEQIAPIGPVYQAGTLSGNPLAMTAGLATLQQLDEAAYLLLEKQAALLQQGLEELISANGLEASVQRTGSMMTLFFHPGPVTDFDAACNADHERFSRFFHSMLAEGVHLPPSGYEAWFLSTAHDDGAIEATLEAAGKALAE